MPSPKFVTATELTRTIETFAQKIVQLQKLLDDDAGPAVESLHKKQTVLESCGLEVAARLVELSDGDMQEKCDLMIQATVDSCNLLLLSGCDVRTVKAVDANEFASLTETLLGTATKLRQAFSGAESQAFAERREKSDRDDAFAIDPWGDD